MSKNYNGNNEDISQIELESVSSENTMYKALHKI